MTKQTTLKIFLILTLTFTLGGCASYQTKSMETTAYCGCGSCCSWERGSWAYLKLDFWNRYVSAGKRTGAHYSGKTAKGTSPREPHPGLFSIDSITRPWVLPFRIIFPWLWLPHDGTIAADTKYYKFGTRMFVPGYGWGVIEDRGGAIKGPRRLDLYHASHIDALKWGRKKVKVDIYQ